MNSFFNGRFADAIGYNPAIFFAIIFAIVFIIILNVDAFFPNKVTMFFKKIVLHPITLLSLVSIYIIVGFSRNFI